MIWPILAFHTMKRPVISKKAHTNESSKNPINHEHDTAQATRRYIPVKPVTARLPFSFGTATAFLLLGRGARMSPFGALILQPDRIRYTYVLLSSVSTIAASEFQQTFLPFVLEVLRMQSTHWSLSLTWNNPASVSTGSTSLGCSVMRTWPLALQTVKPPPIDSSRL